MDLSVKSWEKIVAAIVILNNLTKVIKNPNDSKTLYAHINGLKEIEYELRTKALEEALSASFIPDIHFNIAYMLKIALNITSVREFMDFVFRNINSLPEEKRQVIKSEFERNHRGISDIFESFCRKD